MRALTLERGQWTGLVPHRVGHTQTPDVVHQARMAQPEALRVGQPRAATCLRGEPGDPPRVPGEVRRLQVGQVCHRLQDVVELRTRHRPRRRPLGGQHALPRSRVVEVGQKAVQVAQRAPTVRCGSYSVPAWRPMTRPQRVQVVLTGQHLDRSCQLDEPGREADLLPGPPPGHALAVPLLVALRSGSRRRPRPARGSPRAGSPGPRGWRTTTPRALADHREGGQPAGAPGGRTVRPEPSQNERRDLRPAHGEHPEAFRLHLDVVPEPGGLLGGVRVAVDVHQQPDVVRRLTLRRVGTHQVAQTQRDHGSPQAMLQRLTQTEIRAIRHRRDQLGQPDGRRAIRLHASQCCAGRAAGQGTGPQEGGEERER